MPDEETPTSSSPSPRFIANVSLPQKFDTKGNLATNWKKWSQIWKAYEIVTGLDKQPSALRVATFITCIGPDALEIHTALPFSSDVERENIDKVLELWQSYCMGKTNVIYERYKFNNRSQELDESIDAYTTALRTLAETCEFGSLKEDLIRDRLVCGIRDNSLRKKLLQEPKLTLNKCLDSCRAAEATKLQLEAMTNHNKEPVSTKCRLQTADCRLQTEYKVQTRYKMQTADCRLGIKCRLRPKLGINCRLSERNVFNVPQCHAIAFPSLSAAKSFLLGAKRQH